MGRGRKATWPPPIYQRDGKDFVRLRTGGRVRDITLGPTGSDTSRREYARILAEVEAGSLTSRAADVTVVEVATAHLEWAKGYHGPKQFDRITRALRLVVELYGDQPAAGFGPLALRACVGRWVAEGLARVYVNCLRKTVVKAFRWAVGRELVPASVADALACVEPLRKGKTSAPERERVRPAKRGDVERVLSALAPTLAAMVRLQVLTGMRPGEVCVLRPGDLDRGWRVIAGAAWWLYRLDSHKTDWRGHERWIPISPAAQGVLAPYLDREPDAYCFSPRERLAARVCRYRKRPATANPRWKAGERYTERSYACAIRRACERVGVAYWSPNQLRHMVATEMETLLGREDARCVLGHRSPSVTARYAESVERAAMALAALSARA